MPTHQQSSVAAMTDRQRPIPPAWAWFDQARFGLFIHWGLYSLLGKGEWVMSNDKISAADYAKLADTFTPTRFDADAWAGHAVDAGMRYAVLTTRHHEGFCLWDSQTTDFTSVQHGPKRDIVAEYVAAMRKAGLRVGLYYSLLDWRSSAYWAGPERDPVGWAAFIEEVHAQVRELCSNYGQIDVLWFDGCWPYDGRSWQAERLMTMIRSLQPGIMINDRTGLPGDFDTPEGAILPSGRQWESCQIMQDSWGYHSNEHSIGVWAALNKLTTCASMGGNLLLNVGPRPDGSFPDSCVELMRQVGAWMRVHGDSIYGSQAVDRTYNYHLVTRTRDLIHIHFRWGDKLHWPNWGAYWINGMDRRVVAAWIPATGEQVPFTWKDGEVGITVPQGFPEPFGTVAFRLDPA